MRIAICDDQKELRDEIHTLMQTYMQEHDRSCEIALYQDGKSLLEADCFYDIIFMDIELKRENGMEIISRYPYIKDTKVIFVTSHIEEMPNGYRVRAFRFLVKPIDHDLFYEAVTAALKEISEDGRLLVKDMETETEYMIRFSEIYYVEAQPRAVCIRTEKNYYTYNSNIEKFKELLTGSQFYQTHRSYIVNMDYINEVRKNEIVMKNEERVKISMLKVRDFKEKVFFSYLRRRSDGY